MAAKWNWSQHVTETSDALDLTRDIFTLDDPKAIAVSLKRSLTRARGARRGRPDRRCRKDELRTAFGKPAKG